MVYDINFDQLKIDIDKVKETIIQSQGIDDTKHFYKIMYITNALSILGVITLGAPYYTCFPWLALGLATCARWTMIGHHVSHGGYDWAKLSGYKRGKFAIGLMKRYFDWLDWMLPEAWNLEHNKLHHYNLGEITDPDLLEENMKQIRNIKAPFFLKRLLVVLMAANWKWFYYAPNTYKHYCLNRLNNDNNEEFNKVPKKIKEIAKR